LKQESEVEVDSLLKIQTTLFFKLTTIDTSGETLPNLVQRCINRLVFKFSPSGQGSPILTYKTISTQDNLNNNLFHRITDLKLLTQYDIDVGYELKSSVDPVFVVKDKVETCFGSPSSPETPVTELFPNQSVRITWKQPAVINAPSVCYYLITKKDLVTTQGQIIELSPNQFEYIIQGSERKNRISVKLAAYNEAKCYIGNFPFVSNCITNKTSSKELLFTFDAVKDPNNSSNRVFSDNMFIFLSIFYHLFKFL
jgi:hypothetical protein